MVWPLMLWVSLVWSFDFYLNLAHHTVSNRWRPSEKSKAAYHQAARIGNTSLIELILRKSMDKSPKGDLFLLCQKKINFWATYLLTSWFQEFSNPEFLNQCKRLLLVSLLVYFCEPNFWTYQKILGIHESSSFYLNSPEKNKACKLSE